MTDEEYGMGSNLEDKLYAQLALFFAGHSSIMRECSPYAELRKVGRTEVDIIQEIIFKATNKYLSELMACGDSYYD